MQNHEFGMKKTLSNWDFFTIGFGAIIGTGWIMLVGDWMVIGGGPIPAMIAFVLGALFLLPIGAVFGELTAAIPVSGGIVDYVDRTFGRSASFITGWLLILGNGILCPWEAIAISTLISELFGEVFPFLRITKLYTFLGANVYLIPTAIAISFAGYVIYLNFKGAQAAAKLQSFLIKALLAGMAIAMIASWVKGTPNHLLPVFDQVTGAVATTKSKHMFEGIIAVLVMTPFFYTGFDTIPQQAEEAENGLNWNRFGQIIGMALLASGLFYVVCIYSFGTILPWREFVGSSVPALSCLQHISLTLYMVMLCIAVLSPLGPMNSFYGATTRIMLAMGRKKLLPENFATIDAKNGVPRTAIILIAVLTLIGPFFGKNLLIPLTKVSALAFVFACTMACFACFRMRYTEPELPRPYKVLGGKLGIFLGCICGVTIVLLMIIPSSPATLSAVEWLIVSGWLIIGLMLFFAKSIAENAYFK